MTHAVRTNGPAAGGAAVEAGDRVYAGQRPDTTLRRLELLACNAAAAAGFGGKPPPPKRLRLIAWRLLAKGAPLRGFATVELPIELKLIDCPVLVGKNGPFALLPSKPQVKEEGRQKTDANGKPAYNAILEWRTRDLANQFSTAGGRAGAARTPRRARRGRAMTGERLDEMLTSYLRGERAIAAARRFISRNGDATLRRSNVVEFFRRRRDQLSAVDIEYCATGAIRTLAVVEGESLRPGKGRGRGRGRAIDEGSR
jgi:hypothetical protein